MYIAGGISILLILLLALTMSFGLPILAAVLVYKDAAKRVDCSPWLWALVAGLAPCFIGVIVYLIIKRDYPLKPEYQIGAMHRQGMEGSSYTAYNDMSSPSGEQPKGLPAWVKALIIIAVIIVAILIITAVVGLIKYIFMGITGYGAFGNFHEFDDFHYGF